MRASLVAVLLSLTLPAASCVNTRSDRGVEPRWHDEAAARFAVGSSTRAEVLAALGPPSQILTVGEGSAFYYLLEVTEAKGLILLAYNTNDERTRYDRAVYFFDAQGVLTDFAQTAEPD